MLHTIKKQAFIMLFVLVSFVLLSSCSSEKTVSENVEKVAPKMPEKKQEITTYTAEDYKNAIDEETMAVILKTAEDYYSQLKFLKVKSMEVSIDDRLYQNEGIESEYGLGTILIFDVIAEQDGNEFKRSISIVKEPSGEWKVINEGI